MKDREIENLEQINIAWDSIISLINVSPEMYKCLKNIEQEIRQEITVPYIRGESWKAEAHICKITLTVQDVRDIFSAIELAETPNPTHP